MGSLIFNRIFYKLFLFIVFLKLSIAIDTLLPNQTIAIGQTLVSQSEYFELGFFALGTSGMFLGIWYKNTPDVRVWVANRNNPITDSERVTFGISGNGNLAISRGESDIWSSNSSGAASNPVLQLQDSGNLVLVDKALQSSSYKWQSFDDPINIWLPGMNMVDDVDAGVSKYLTSWRNSSDPSPGDFVFKIENHGLPQMVVFSGEKRTFRTGTWNGLAFNGYPVFPDAIVKPITVFKQERLISMTSPYDSSVFTRTTLNLSGLVNRDSMSTTKDKWNLVNTFPADLCDQYGRCGPNGVCKIEKAKRCECFNGFTPKSQTDWDHQDWAGGCTRITPLNCSDGNGFLPVMGVKYPDMLNVRVNISMSLDECRDACLKDCSCTAYANAYVTNGGSGCVMWFGDLVDTREVHGADSKQIIYIRSPISEKDSTTNLEKGKGKKKRPTKLILVLIASGVLVSGFISLFVLVMIRRKRRVVSKHNDEDLELPIFKLETIKAATNNFSEENMIGEGGFGPVYKGKLSAEEEIAVKRLSKTSGQGLEEFKNEVILIAKLQHVNLVRLLGCCIEGEERMLIYEYLQNKSLDNFVFDKNRSRLLTWPKCFDIIMGIARGLLYLHHDSRLKIIHRDLKASNILLDENLNPKISDFGLARIFEENQPIAKTRRVVGTYGYMSPEYAFEGKFSVKSDVFSMGVVLLEIVSGKKNRGFDHHSLLGQAWLLWKENRVLELMDDCLSDTFIESQVKRCIQVGLLCVQKFAKDRPEMSSVLFMLGADGVILPQPKEPGLFMDTSSSSEISILPFTKSAKETITITDLVAR